MSTLPPSLRHSSDQEPGIRRRPQSPSGQGGGFAYFAPDGTAIRNPDILARIEGLGLPPAYSDVWICQDEKGHIQATGRDDKTRKQYRYHDLWRDFRDQQKFDQLSDFADILPRLRAKIARDLRRDMPDYRFVCAALTRLIDRGALRIGNRGSAGASFGASTLRTRHLSVSEDGFQLDFKAKGGKRVRKTIRDKTLARTLDEIDDLPGRELFQYRDPEGDVRSVDSADVNQYIPDGFTTKAFRTWHGTVAAFKAAQIENPTIKSLTEAAAERLHNTPAICRSSYIHPKVIDLANMSEDARRAEFKALRPPKRRGLRAAERACLAYISDA